MTPNPSAGRLPRTLCIMNVPPSSEQLRLASLGAACWALYELLQAGITYSAGSMENIACHRLIHRLFCEVGSVLGHLFEPNSALLGYVLLKGLFGTFMVSVAWLIYVRSKA